VQIQIYKALGYAVPTFAHMALLKTKDGELSKRVGGNDIRALREQGILPMAINSLLAHIGTSDAVAAYADMQALVDGFDFKKFGRAPANYDIHELEKLNEKLVHRLPFDEVREQISFADESFWLSVRDNLKNLGEARMWWDILCGAASGEWRVASEDKEFLKQAATLLPPEPWNEGTYDAWIAALKPTTPRKGKELFMPIRKALTGLDNGPELKKLLPLLGAHKTRQRLTC
jgi:glutamyl-tRNA synthetase